MVDIASCKTFELFNGSRVMAWEVVSRFDEITIIEIIVKI